MSNIHENAYFFSPQPSKPDRPLFIFLPGLDETGKEMISLQTKSLDAFDVCSFIIPPDDLDDWDSLSQTAIALTKAELALVPRMSVYLCGESFGGSLALFVILKAPELFDKIILINPASSFHRVPWLDLGSLLFALTPNFLYDLSAILSLPFLAPLKRLSPQARVALENAAKSAPKNTAQQRIAMMRNFKVDETRLKQIDRPVLLIGSEKDRILPSVAEVKRLAKIFLHPEVVTLPDSGHACLIETDINLYEIMKANNFVS